MTLEWNPAFGATGYEVAYAQQPTFSDADTVAVPGTEHELTALAGAMWYYWRVRACDASGCSGPWSAVWSFNTGTDAVQRYYYLTDHLGSVRATINAQGIVVHYDDYYPFGLQMPQRSMETPEAPKERYSGKELDTETGLEYYGARYYDPVIVRWLAVDPLAEKHPDWSPYNFVLANPLRLVDPDGRQISAINGEWVHFRAAQHVAARDPSRSATQVYEQGAQFRRGQDQQMAKAYLVMASMIPASYAVGGVVGTVADAATGGLGPGSLLNWLPGGRVTRRAGDLADAAGDATRIIGNIVDGIGDFRRGLADAASSIGADKIGHILKGSRGSDHAWELILNDVNFDDVQKIIQEVAESGQIMTRTQGEWGTVAKKANGQWVAVKWGRRPSGGMRINDAYVVTNKVEMKELEELANGLE